MQRQSEEVLGLMTTTDEVVSSIETHGVKVATRLDEQATRATTREAQGANAPNFRSNMFHIRDNLTGSVQNMADKDQRHVHQLAEVIQLRQERQVVQQDVYDTMTTLRNTLDSLYGPGQAFVLAGVEGPTARKAKKLVRQTDLAASRLEQDGLELPPSRLGGIRLDLKAVAADLRSKLERLRAVLAAQKQALRISQETRKEKNRAKESHERLLLWSARTLEGYYQLAGEHELAERIRPATRRLGRPVSSGTPDTPGDEPPATPPDEDDPDESEPDDPDSEDSEEIALFVTAPSESATSTADD